MKLLLCTLMVAATISRAGQVVLTSDPPGATIFAGDKQLGTTPLTTDLPPSPIELTSRFGSLSPVVQTVAPDDKQIVASYFKHAYGTLIVSSDRTDATLRIDGADLGHPPALVIISPGSHKIFLNAPNEPDKTRSVDVGEGERASIEIHFKGGSPETTTSGPSPTVSASPAKAASLPTAAPQPSPKAKPDPQLLVWQELPQAIPQANPSQSPQASVSPSPSRKVAQTPTSAHFRLVQPQASPSSSPDPAKTKALLDAEWKAKQSELAAERQRIDYEIANSTGATRETWKYRLALWRLRKQEAKQNRSSAQQSPSKPNGTNVSPVATPDPAKTKTEYALLQSEWKAKQSALSAEKQRIDYEMKNSTGLHFSWCAGESFRDT